MIKVDKLSYSYPQKDLYNQVSFTIDHGQHCAFIGSNGSGKSTLVDMIMDLEKYMYDGSIEIDSNRKIGYVSQFSQLDETKDTTVFEYVAEEFIKLQNEITYICSEMENSSDIEDLLEKYQQVLDAFDAIDGGNFESNINNKLSIVNLIKYRDIKVSDLSGGEFKLIQVIKEMLTGPDLIIMDEPDVFLDFENINSLKNLINSHKETLLIITHNRYLLDHCFNKIIHLEDNHIQEFDGKFIEYNLLLLQTKIEQQELAAADDEEILRNENLINKLRIIATNNSDSAKGRSLKARVKIQERLEKSRINPPFVDISQPEICLINDENNEEQTILEVNNYSVSFDDILLENINFEIKSKDKVAIIGSNGTGKTTLLKDIFKNDKESIQIKDGIKLEYLSQIQEEILNESNTIMEEFLDVGFETIQEIELYISKYGFYEDDLNRKIDSLSGGEKNILQLAKVSHRNANLLLLDEPKSHLDIYSQLALDNSIKEYNGAILMISHDFYSIINCMDYVLIIEDKSIRRMSIKKFKKMIYSKFFDKNYLELEQKKKSVETKIALALKDNNFEVAKILSEELEELVEQF